MTGRAASTGQGRGGHTRLFVISLDDAHDRREIFAGHAAATTLEWRFFDAHRCVGDHLDHDADVARRTHGRDLKAGELGCYSSHSALWLQLLRDETADQYIVLEDDVMADWSALEVISSHDFASVGHHYVRLYGRKPSPFQLIENDYLPGPRALLNFTGKPFGTQGYVITREGARAMLAACRRVVRPLDDQMDRFWEHGIPNLALFPFPLVERFAPSTIGGARFQGRGGGRSRAQRWRDLVSRRIAAARFRLFGLPKRR